MGSGGGEGGRERRGRRFLIQSYSIYRPINIDLRGKKDVKISKMFRRNHRDKFAFFFFFSPLFDEPKSKNAVSTNGKRMEAEGKKRSSSC